MIIILFFIAITLIVSTIVYAATEKSFDKLSNALACLIVMTGSFTIVTIFILAGSYQSYIDLHKMRSTFAPRLEIINAYAEKATGEFLTLEGKEITDLKYQHYQTTLGEMMTDFRRAVTYYNENLVGKRIMKESPFFSWLIVAPDPDMKEVSVVELLKKH